MGFFTTLVLAAALASCSGEISGVLRKDGSADIQARSALLPSVTALVGAVSGGGATTLDAKTISASFSSARGIEKADFRNTTPSSVGGVISVSHVNEFLRGQNSRLIEYTQDGSGGRLAISLDRTNAPGIVRLLSPDIADYLSCLMAPCSSQDWQFITTKTEYLRQIKATYNTLRGNKGLGNTLASDLRNAVVRLSLELPGTVASAKGGSFSGKRASFEVPVLDLLVLEKPITYEVLWN
jgi:hypothetical protein